MTPAPPVIIDLRGKRLQDRLTNAARVAAPRRVSHHLAVIWVQAVLSSIVDHTSQTRGAHRMTRLALSVVALAPALAGATFLRSAGEPGVLDVPDLRAYDPVEVLCARGKDASGKAKIQGWCQNWMSCIKSKVGDVWVGCVWGISLNDVE